MALNLMIFYNKFKNLFLLDMFKTTYYTIFFFVFSFFGLLGQEVKVSVGDSLSEKQIVRPQTVNSSLWKKNFKVAALVNQTSFNNDWKGGGASNLATNANIEYKVNYKKGTWALDNIMRLAYGITKLNEEKKFRKTDDNVELNATLFKNINNTLWSYSTFFNFKSQFAKGYNFKKDNSRILISDRLSPAFFQFGPGVLYKKSENFKVNIAPSTARLILVDPFFTQTKSAFGVEKGKAQNVEFGASIIANYKFILAKNVTIENLMNLYSNYLGNVSNVDIDYTLNMNSKINKHMSANFTFQAIYDDDTVRAFQIRELISLGLNLEI